MWFTLGALLGIVSIIPSIVLLCTTAYGGIIATAHGKDTTANTEQLLVAMVPGINIPLSELCYYFVTLLLCSTVHEVGHAVASCCEGVGVQRCGLFVIAVIPAAFVDIPSRQLNRIGTFKQLRIFCAGIWHNVILTGVAYLILISVPLLSEPFYSQNAGVYVTSVVQGSSVGGIAGLVDGDTITQINDCLVENKSDWVSCLSNTISQKQGYCVPEIAVSETEVLSHIANRSHYDKYFCCPIDNPSAFCFDTRRQQKVKSYSYLYKLF
ncbi:MBTPS2 (predicted) [Pycnogonum litorale]